MLADRSHGSAWIRPRLKLFGVNDRLRWVAAPPLMTMNKVYDELARAKENGACGIFTCGFAADRELWNPYFFPLYEIAQELNLPICLHAGVDSFAYHDLFEESDALAKFKFPVISAFHALLLQDIPRRFPALRWGFIEAGSGWLISKLPAMLRPGLVFILLRASGMGK